MGTGFADKKRCVVLKTYGARECAPTFTLMPATSTSMLSVQVLGFESIRLLTQHDRLVCDFCSCRFLFIRPALCPQLPLDSTSRWTSRRVGTNSSPYRACRRLDFV